MNTQAIFIIGVREENAHEGDEALETQVPISCLQHTQFLL